MSMEKSRPRAVIIGARYKNLISGALENLGLRAIYMPDNPNVDSRVAGHADLSVLRVGVLEIYLAKHLKNTRFEDEIISLGYNVIYQEIEQRETYPYDADFNICIVGSYMFCGRNNRLAGEVSARAELTGITCAQGYTRCSTCIVSDSAIITADSSIETAAKKHGFDVLKINPGYFSLPGYDYGFIGGASFKLNSDTLCFTGSISGHQSRDEILAFLSKHNITPIFLLNECAIDIGTAVLL